jgi:hypothetical protein
MTRTHIVASVLVLLMIAAPWGSATAEPILYTIKFVASGTVGGVPFTDEPLVFAGVTDTDTVTALVEAEADPTHLQQRRRPAAGSRGPAGSRGHSGRAR